MGAFGGQLVERLGLLDGPGEAVEDVATLGVGHVEPLLDDADHDVVGQQLARVHVRLGLEPESLPLRTAARSMSPVEMCGTP